MIFLIEYDRRKQRLIKFDRFKNSQRTIVEKTRLDLELNLNQKSIQHEVVLLEATNEKMLRRTHRRYFESVRELRDSATQS